MRRYYGEEYGDIMRKKPGKSDVNTIDDLFNVLMECWCKETAYPSCQAEWLADDPTYGQCAVTAMLVYDMFGGSIHRIRSDGSTHYFNKVDGHYIDLTVNQFDLYNIPVQYEPNEEMNRKYCGKNADTNARYKLLIKRIYEKLSNGSSE